MTDKRTVFLENQRFGKLVAISYIKPKKYLCKCDCGNEKIIISQHLKMGHTRSCGCISSIYRENYDEDMKNKFMSSIEICQNGCWIWKKSKHRQGYGNFPYKRKVVLAHRMAWMLFRGPLSADILVCHNCPQGDNPSCVNPGHLFLGTDKDNTQDYIKKGRARKSKGENHYFAKLSEENVLEIRKLAELGVKYKELSNKFNISYGHTKDLVRRRSWKHI